MVAEHTPDPGTLRYWLDREIGPREPLELRDAERARAVAPIATDVLACEGVACLRIGRDFVEVTRHAWAEWDALGREVARRLAAFLESGVPAVLEAPIGARDRASEESALARLRVALDERVRPLVAAHGGDVALLGLRSGVVELELRGACADRPGALGTLQHQIATQVMRACPEVREVVARSSRMDPSSPGAPVHVRLPRPARR